MDEILKQIEGISSRAFHLPVSDSTDMLLADIQALSDMVSNEKKLQDRNLAIIEAVMQELGVSDIEDLVGKVMELNKKSPTPYYLTYANLEESGELIGFEPVDGYEEDYQAMKDDRCPNCQGECKMVSLRNDIGVLRVFSVCVDCDTAMEF